MKKNQSKLIDKILNLKRPTFNLNFLSDLFNKIFEILGES